MKQIITPAIVLKRAEYGEADRLVTFLTAQHGKIIVIAKGVRKQKSKLAGGIELFTVSDISFIEGRSEIKTLTSTRLSTYFGHITSAIDRTQAGYEMLSTIHKITEVQPNDEYYIFLEKALVALNTPGSNIDKVMLWYYTHLLWVDGHAPNLASNSFGESLQANSRYNFDFEAMAFESSGQGIYNALHIKLLRVAMGKSPEILEKLKMSSDVLAVTLKLVKRIYDFHFGGSH